MECKRCEGLGYIPPTGHATSNNSLCPACGGLAILNIDPHKPCEAVQGTPLRIATYAARIRANLPVWNSADFKDDRRGS